MQGHSYGDAACFPKAFVVQGHSDGDGGGVQVHGYGSAACFLQAREVQGHYYGDAVCFPGALEVQGHGYGGAGGGGMQVYSYGNVGAAGALYAAGDGAYTLVVRPLELFTASARNGESEGRGVLRGSGRQRRRVTKTAAVCTLKQPKYCGSGARQDEQIEMCLASRSVVTWPPCTRPCARICTHTPPALPRTRPCRGPGKRPNVFLFLSP